MFKPQTLAIVLYLLFAAHANAQTLDEQLSATFKAGGLMLIYTPIIPMLANGDDTPRLQIYSDGKVLVHYPSYMKQAGDYQYQLSTAQLTQIKKSLEDDEISAFDPSTLLKQQQRLAKTQTSLFYVSDETTTLIAYRPPSVLKDGQNKIKQLKIQNLRTNAKRYPQLTVLNKIVNIEQMLNDVLTQTAEEGPPQ